MALSALRGLVGEVAEVAEVSGTWGARLLFSGGTGVEVAERIGAAAGVRGETITTLNCLKIPFLLLLFFFKYGSINFLRKISSSFVKIMNSP